MGLTADHRPGHAISSPGPWYRHWLGTDDGRPLVERALGLPAWADLVPAERPAAVIRAVYGLAGQPPSELRSPGRYRCQVVPRQAVCWLLVRRLGLSSVSVGRRVGRDHATVLHAVARVDGHREAFAQLLDPVEEWMGWEREV